MAKPMTTETATEPTPGKRGRKAGSSTNNIPTFKLAKAGLPVGKIFIPKGTQLESLQVLVDQLAGQARAAGISFSRCAGTIRLFN